MNFLAKADAKTHSLTATPVDTAHIHTEPKFAEPDAQGNHHQQLGEFTITGGEVCGMNDVWFAVRTLPHTLKTTPTAANPTHWSQAA